MMKLLLSLLVGLSLSSSVLGEAFAPTYLKASDATEADQFGSAVAIDGDTAVVGARGFGGGGVVGPGAAYVYVRSGSVWQEQAILLPSFSPGLFPDFGLAVAISGDRIVVGDRQSDRAYVYSRSGTVWNEEQILAGGFNDEFGTSVSIDGDTIVVGAPLSDGIFSNTGSAHVYERQASGLWSPTAIFEAPVPDTEDSFGRTVAVSGSTIAVSAFGDDSGSSLNPSDNSVFNAGAVYVFEKAGLVWNQQVILKMDNPLAGDLLGLAMDLDGDRLVASVGFREESRRVTVFDRIPAAGTWHQSADVEVEGVELVALDGDHFITGRAGRRVRVFSLNNGRWFPQADLVPEVDDSDDIFGAAIALSDGTALVGAQWEDGGSTGLNGDPTDDSAFLSGAAYFFRALSASRPQGWALLQWPYLYDAQTGAWFAFWQAGTPTTWHYDREAETWDQFDSSDDGWYWMGSWPYLYESSNGAWHYWSYNNVSWMGDTATGAWSLLREPVE